ncbi:glycosyltransferase [Bdellovibrio bacteriovorus]|uniref:glycosyltransferase n=1 Tax=Bdellovibrio bacteriovorus TaxID=959 RepID=UPI0035A90EB2
MTKLPISVVIITLNEEAHIERCIRSVPFADDIVVVDSFSTDRTVEIAEKCGARVFKEKWKGFGPQKSFRHGTSQKSLDHFFGCG